VVHVLGSLDLTIREAAFIVASARLDELPAKVVADQAVVVWANGVGYETPMLGPLLMRRQIHVSESHQVQLQTGVLRRFDGQQTGDDESLVYDLFEALQIAMTPELFSALQEHCAMGDGSNRLVVCKPVALAILRDEIDVTVNSLARDCLPLTRDELTNAEKVYTALCTEAGRTPVRRCFLVMGYMEQE
jgi:hypothetical protein